MWLLNLYWETINREPIPPNQNVSQEISFPLQADNAHKSKIYKWVLRTKEGKDYNLKFSV